jgi:hypothetical protein
MTIIAEATEGLAWPQLMLAALGSSAIGAVVGGILTTRMRGTIEREEAWRTRIIEAADDVASALSQADLDFNAILFRDAADGRRQLRAPDGTLEKDVSGSLRACLDGVRRANKLLSRVELLYGPESQTHRHALATVYGLSGSVRLLEGNLRAHRAVLAVIATRAEDSHTIEELIGRDDVAHSRYRLLLSQGDLPTEFRPDDDASVAAWALRLHDGAADAFHEFVREASQASRAAHPIS